MKKFILRITLISFVYISLSLFVYFQFFFRSIDSDVERTILLASAKYPFVIKKIRIGDSVAKQLHKTGAQPDSGIINLTSNGGVSLLAHYLLLKKITTVNKDNLSDSLQIEGYFRPSSMTNNLDAPACTNYFIKRFYSDDLFFNPALLSEQDARYLDSSFLRNYSKRKIIRLLIPVKATHKILSIPGVLNPSVPVPKNQSLLEALEPLMARSFPTYKAYYCPISKTFAAGELLQTASIKSIWKPSHPFQVLEDSLFSGDKVHFKE